MSDLVEEAGAFFESIENIIKGLKRHVDAGRVFDAVTKECVEQLCLCCRLAAERTGTTELDESLQEALDYFSEALKKPEAKVESLEEVAAEYYNNITSTLTYYYQQELDGQADYGPELKNVLTQVSHAVRKLILNTKTQLDPNDHRDKLLGNTLQEYAPKTPLPPKKDKDNDD